MNNPNRVVFDAYVLMFDNGDEREPEFRILNVTGESIPMELLAYLNGKDGQENELYAFQELPRGRACDCKITAFWDDGDPSAGLFSGWSVENVEVEKEYANE